MSKTKILKLRPGEWYGVAVYVEDDEAFRIASIRLGVPPEQLEIRVTGGAKLFRIMEEAMFARQDQKGQMQVSVLQKRCQKQEKEIVALRVIAKGCKKHPTYRGMRKSKVECEACVVIYKLAQEYLKKKKK